jgi:methionyl-tRNA formyltransferase
LGWSQIIKKDILKIPKIGCIGSHPTELPKYRGRAPIPWSIIKGLKESALTFFWLEEGVDTGDILIQKKFPIDINDTAKDVYDKMISVGNEMLKEIYSKFLRGDFPHIPQNPDDFIEEWPARTEKDSEIDWTKSDIEIHNQIRAVAGVYPWAYTYINGKKLLFKRSIYKNGKLIIEGVEFE